jgi:hypothetical protein
MLICVVIELLDELAECGIDPITLTLTFGTSDETRDVVRMMAKKGLQIVLESAVLFGVLFNRNVVELGSRGPWFVHEGLHCGIN